MAEYRGVSGALYTNSYKSSENQPDYTGEVDLSKEVIDAIRQQMESKVNGKGTPINFDEGTVDSDVLALLSVITGDYQSKRLREPLRINIP